ncbi:MAG: hypothetical protein LBP76_10250 [Treponema sp.]|jgi:hypothetical protein|nr:hypothetical protein [Treponema sp.]
MTDFLSRFGAVTNTGSENTLDFGPIDGRAAMQSHRTGEQHEAAVVFHAAANITGAVTPKLQDSDDNTTFTDLVTGQAVTNPKAGAFAFFPMPKTHRRYVRAALAAAATGVTAYLEPGPAKPEK